jgi:RNA polymerase sigma-70 factor (ECF subfamily)
VTLEYEDDDPATSPGTDPAIERFVDTYAPRIYRIALYLCGSTEDAGEVTLATLEEAIRKIHAFQQASAFGSWLYGVAVRMANERSRERQPEREIVLEDVLPPLDDEGRRFRPIEDWSARLDAASPRELHGALRAAIAGIPTGDRAALVLHDVEGFSIAKVAAVLGVDLATVRSRVHQSRLFLRQKLADSRIWCAQPIGGADETRDR